MTLHVDFLSSYLVAFTMGLFSSLHCIGMCGSIIGTLTLSLDAKIRKNKWQFLTFICNYNLGRIFSYSVAGAIAGLLTLPFDTHLGHRFLQLFSAALILSAGFYVAGWFPHFAYIEKLGRVIWKKLEPIGHKLIPVKTRTQAFLFGTIWGWLPCGLVYAALILAATTGDVTRSALTMLSFGIGTLPAVVGAGIISRWLSSFMHQRYIKQLIGILMILLALAAAFPWLYPMRIEHALM